MDTETLATVEDADLGTLDLIREHFRAKSLGDADWKELSLLGWRGHHQSRDGLSFDISVYVESDSVPSVPDIPANARASFQRLIADEKEFRKSIAEQRINLAVDWASENEALPRPTVESFTQALRLTDVQFDPDRITFWYAEDQDIFAGHGLEVRLDTDGRIKEIGLAG